MNIGDRVRLMSGREEGTITRLLEGGMIEVAIDGEFTMPLLRSDVVLIAAEETKTFGGRAAPPPMAPPKPGSTPRAPRAAPRLTPASRAAPHAHPAPAPPAAPAPPEKAPAPVSSAPPAPQSPGKPAPLPPPPPPPPPAVIGAYLGLVHQAEELLALQLINNSDDDLLYTYGEERQQQYRGVKSGHVGPREAVVLAHRHLADFETWPGVVLQYLPHRAGATQPGNLEAARVRFKADSFYGSRGLVPVLKAEGYVYRLAEHKLVTTPPAPEPLPINPVQLAAQMQTPAPAPVPAAKLVPPPHEMDLHLDKLPDAPKGDVSNSEALRLQMAAFEDALHRALACNMHEIIFIHGTGNGVLRKEIQRALSRNRDIKFFEDARKDKFGFGATLVRLK